MSTTIDGSSGVTFPAGGTGNPAGTVVGTTDTQTLTNKTISNITSAAATALTLQSAGTTAVTIDTSQNVGIGTSSPNKKLEVLSAGEIIRATSNTGANDQVISIKSNSGTADCSTNIFFADRYAATSYASSYIRGTASGTSALIFATGGTNFTNIYDAGAPTERMRIDSSGNLLVGATATSNGGKFLVAQPAAASQSAVFQSTNATAGNNYGILITYTAATPNGTGNSFLYCNDSTQLRAEIRSNGGLANFSANNVNLSDERLKTDIQNAGSYLSKICAIPVRTFKYKDQTDDLLNLGVIAQEVESVAPELVDISGFGKTPEDGVSLKAIYQTDLQYALMKCIQEQQTIIEQLKARIEALESK